MTNNLYIQLGGAVTILLLLSFAVGIYLYKKHRVRPIKMPPKRDQERVRRELLVDIDTSTLTNPTETTNGTAHYLVLDTETYEAISFLNESSGTYKLSQPIALSWQILDSKGLLIEEQSFILHQQGETPMTLDAIDIHGISNEELNQGIAPQVAYQALEQQLSCTKCIVAHNLRFHIDTLTADLKTKGMNALAEKLMHSPQQLCTMEWGKQLGFKHFKGGEALYPSIEELFGYLYFRRMHLPLGYKSKTIRDIRLVSACLRMFIGTRSNTA